MARIIGYFSPMGKAFTNDKVVGPAPGCSRTAASKG